MRGPSLVLVGAAALAIAVLGAGLEKASAAEVHATSCLACHSDSDLFEGPELEIVRSHSEDVHASVGISCHDCHGGNPDPELSQDVEAMDETFEGDPYVGVPERGEVPGFCGRCHSDPVYMMRFKPDARVDQEREYWTSQHGVALGKGDDRVATCTDCHGVHDIRAVAAPESRVYPTKVAETCNGCHGDAARMSGHVGRGGEPLPVDQFALWRRSVHAEAMFAKEDLTAPTCNDCHGNHGAAPPGLDSVAFVCGQCHGREADIFRNSPKHAGFEAHNELLADADGCADCHESPQAELEGMHEFTECTTCHGNHGIVRPTLAMFSDLPETPCGFCHGDFGLAPGTTAESRKVRESFGSVRAGLLAQAEAEGLTGQDRFDWLIDQARELSQHSTAGPSDENAVLRPEFAKLFDKFRLGKSYFSYEDPLTGEPVRVDLVRCDSCHASEDEAGGDGVQTGSGLIRRMAELTASTARAERILLAARRGGVETREGMNEVDQAVASQIGLEVLVHGFSVEEGSEFAERHLQGIEHARVALAKGQLALDELAYRRKGLAVALAIIAAVLLALALKIRALAGSD